MSLELDRVYGEDCLKGLKRLAPGSIDLAFADPPFNIGYAYDVYDDRKGYDQYLEWTRQWTRAVAEVLKPTGTFWVAIGDEYAAEMKLILQNDLGLICRSWVVWYYTFGVNCKYKFTRSHAHLFYFVKDRKRFTFNIESIRVPSARQLVYADKRAVEKGRLPDDTWILRPQDLSGGFRAEEDTWYFSRVCGTFKERRGWHGCQMPEQLLGRIIKACSRPEETVLDPFAGSGTTLAVAKKLHRHYVGFEISRKYVKQINERLGDVQPGEPLEGAEDPLTSAPSTAEGKRLGERRGRRRPGAKRDGAARLASGSSAMGQLGLSLGQVATANGEFTTAIAQAYLVACDGYAIDRVLADPTLNEAFQRACCDLEVPGEARDWNRRLLGLRKAGKLASLPTPRRTSLSWDELDRFLFASEIAWEILSTERGVSLDDILCDPNLASEFDQTAYRFAPGWTPFHYRWGALTLRKKAALKKKLAQQHPAGRISKRQLQGPTRGSGEIDGIPESPGLYLLETPATKLYLGETGTLRVTIAVQMKGVENMLHALHVSEPDAHAVRWRPISLPRLDRKQRWGAQSRILAELRPVGNVVQIQALSA